MDIGTRVIVDTGGNHPNGTVTSEPSGYTVAVQLDGRLDSIHYELQQVTRLN